MKNLYLFTLLFICKVSVWGQIYNSPKNKIGVTLTQNSVGLSLEVTNNQAVIMNIDSVLISVDGVVSKEKIKFLSAAIKNENFAMTVPLKFKNNKESYNHVSFSLGKSLNFELKIYDDAVAYKFIPAKTQKGTTIDFENASIRFDSESKYFYPKEDNILSHYERAYIVGGDDSLVAGSFCSLPMIAKSKNINICISETNLYNYPNFFLKKTAKNTLSMMHPKVVLEIIPQQGRRLDRNETLKKEANYIAKTSSDNLSLPWRTFAIGDDASLLTNQINHKLSDAPIGDFSWVKPGKVAWDWYNANLITGVDFKNGINNDTYKYYIDFASKYGLEYIIIDEGWSKSTLDVIGYAPNINIEELVEYGKSKNVGVILWLLWKPLDDNLESILTTYQKWGVKGIKVDFMQRADQYMVEYYERVAKSAANHKLLVDFHGAYKPTGLHVKYPNVMSYEGLRGNENNKWSNWASPLHNLTLPFTRMVAGAMDYTPGALRNAHPKDFTVSFNHPMSMTTRAHQAAMYVIYESPLQMLCDLPSEYLKENDYTTLISKVPTVWHDTKVLEASIGNNVIMARQNGSNWYLAGMTNKQFNSKSLDLAFLGEGRFKATLLTDGVNIANSAEDFSIKNLGLIQKDSKVSVSMYEGGGFLMVLEKQ
jgi:alpha-glucosidase